MDKAEKKKIRILKDGPYEVFGRVPLDLESLECDADGGAVAYDKNSDYVQQETVCLCRCGHSKDKPYCDGTHIETGFRGRETADRPPYAERAELQRGDGVDLMDDESLCAGARFCDVGESAWGYVEQSADPDKRDLAIREACDCPAGRLTAVDHDGNAIEPALEPGITALQDPARDCRGPLWVKGGIQVEGANGEQYEVRNRVTLCRCGESSNQPYCDASHYGCPHMQGLDE